MKTLFVSTSILGLLICTLSTGCSTSEDAEAARKETLSLSNKLAEATAKLSEKEAAFDTLRVTSELQANDFKAVSNRVQALKVELSKAVDAQRQSAAQAQARAAELAATHEQFETQTQMVTQLGTELKEVRNELAATLTHLKTAQQHAADLTAQLNASEAARAQFLQKWADTALVRAQLRTLRRTPKPGADPFAPVDLPVFSPEMESKPPEPPEAIN